MLIISAKTLFAHKFTSTDIIWYVLGIGHIFGGDKIKLTIAEYFGDR